MRTLVIGGTQFMGREIVRRLVARGHEVSVLHRGDRHELGPEVRNLRSDRGDLPRVTALLKEERFEAVFDLAYDEKQGTTADQVEAVARSCGDRLHRYVFMSSIAAYLPGLDHREGDALVPDDFAFPYSQHKASTERMLFRLHAESGFPATTFRPPFVYGPNQPLYREQFFWDRLFDRRPIILPDGGSSPMQWAYVSDVAEACVRAMEVPEAVGQAFNIAHVESTTQRGFVESLARVAGVEPVLVDVPRARIQTAGGQLFGRDIYFGDFLDLPPYTEIVEKAPRILGVTPTAFEASLRNTLLSYKTHPRRPADYAFEDRLLAKG